MVENQIKLLVTSAYVSLLPTFSKLSSENNGSRLNPSNEILPSLSSFFTESATNSVSS